MEGYILSATFFFNSLLIVVLCHYKPKYYKEILSKKKVTDETLFLKQIKTIAKRFAFIGVLVLLSTPFLNQWVPLGILRSYLYLALGILGFLIAFKK